MSSIQWSLGTLACFAMVMSPTVRPCVAEEPPAARAPAATAPAKGAQESTPSAADGAKESTATVDLSYIPASAVGAVVVHPRPFFSGPNAEIMPVEVVTAWGMQNAGFDPTQIEEIVLIGAPPEAVGTQSSRPNRRGAEPEFGAVVHFAAPYSPRNVFAKLQPLSPTLGEVDGKKYAVTHGPMPLAIYFPNARTMVVGSVGLVRQMITADAVDSKLTRLLRGTDCSGTATAVFSLDAVRPLVDQAIANIPPLPPQFAEFLDIPKLISSGVVKLDLRDPMEFSATLHTANAASAEHLQQLIEQGLDMAHQMAIANMTVQQASTDDPVQQAMQRYSMRMSERTFKALKPKRDGTDVKWSVASRGSPLVYTAVIGILIALLLPAVEAAREAARRNQAQAKLKQIGLSLMNYESAYGRLPARAVFSKDGEASLSWRVMILPYLEESALYKEFRMDEPWDSPHNRALISRMPNALADPNDPQPGHTHFVVPVGKGLMFDGDKGTRLADVSDGLSKTILALEADKSVIWTKPDDLEIDMSNPAAGLGHLRPTGFTALFGDDHFEVLPESIDPELLKAMFTIAGGEDFQTLYQRFRQSNH